MVSIYLLGDVVLRDWYCSICESRWGGSNGWVTLGGVIIYDEKCYQPYQMIGSNSYGYYYGPDFKKGTAYITVGMFTMSFTFVIQHRSSTTSVTPTITPTTTPTQMITPTVTPTKTVTQQ